MPSILHCLALSCSRRYLSSFAMSSCHLLLGRPLDLFPLCAALGPSIDGGPKPHQGKRPQKSLANVRRRLCKSVTGLAFLHDRGCLHQLHYLPTITTPPITNHHTGYLQFDTSNIIYLQSPLQLSATSTTPHQCIRLWAVFSSSYQE